MKKIFLIILINIVSFAAIAAQDFYRFEKPEDQQRFLSLTSELRCLVCQNQNIAESNAPLANDLRDQIYQKIQKGESNEAIIRYLIDRYGNFVLYQPPFNLKTLALWLGPFLFLIAGIIWLLRHIRLQSKVVHQDSKRDGFNH